MSSQTGASVRLTVGRYAICGEIARGGMATVHYGRLLGSVGFSRVVAIKRLHEAYSGDPDFVSMFVDEARIAARIRHPNVVTVLDVVRGDGELLLVMEYVEGEALSRLLRSAWQQKTRIPTRITLGIMNGVLHGLHAAHEAKNEQGKPLEIVHRDVSPHNIVVGADGVARVVDFGIAKAAGRLQNTRGGEVKGKLAYMSPEQIAERPVDRRTDIYAASIVLWEALAGRRLFDGNNDGAVVLKVLDGCRTAPSQYANDLPEGLDEIVLRGLSYRPDDRYPTAREMAVAIESVTALPSPREISEWVHTMAREALAERALRVAELESAVHVSPSEAVISVPQETQPVVATSSSQASAPALASVSHSDATGVSVASLAPRALRRRAWRSASLLGAAVLVLAGGIVGVLALASPPTPAKMLARSPTPPLRELAPDALDVAPDLEPAPSGSAEPSGPRRGHHGTTDPFAIRSLPRAKPGPSAAPSSNCNPPYTITSDGVRRYKTECLK